MSKDMRDWPRRHEGVAANMVLSYATNQILLQALPLSYWGWQPPVLMLLCSEVVQRKNGLPSWSDHQKITSKNRSASVLKILWNLDGVPAQVFTKQLPSVDRNCVRLKLDGEEWRLVVPPALNNIIYHYYYIISWDHTFFPIFKYIYINTYAHIWIYTIHVEK